MSQKYKETATIIEQKPIAAGIFSLWLQTEAIAAAARPGQFVSVYSRDQSRMLPRPISICEADAQTGRLRLVYRVAGKGTEEFSSLGAGDVLELLGPLGNGFPLERMAEGKSAFLIGGGIGIPPMLQLAKEAAGEKQVILGFKDERFLTEDLERYGRIYIATEDGSFGTRGNVLDCIRENHLRADVIFACGPTPMLRALKTYARENGTECWLSLEERMACGIGACLACVCRSTEVDEHSQVKNKRVCREGPVFEASEVEL